MLLQQPEVGGPLEREFSRCQRAERTTSPGVKFGTRFFFRDCIRDFEECEEAFGSEEIKKFDVDSSEVGGAFSSCGCLD